MELQSKYQQADAKVQMLEQTTAQLRSKLEQKQRALEVSCLYFLLQSQQPKILRYFI